MEFEEEPDMMKKLLSLLLAAGMCLSMAACTSADNTSSGSTADSGTSSGTEETASDVEDRKSVV